MRNGEGSCNKAVERKTIMGDGGWGMGDGDGGWGMGDGGGGAPLRRIDCITHTLTLKLYVLSVYCYNRPLQRIVLQIFKTCTTTKD